MVYTLCNSFFTASSNETTSTSTPISETTTTSTSSSETAAISTSSTETTAISTPSSETTATSTPSSETTAIITPRSETSSTSTLSNITAYVFIYILDEENTDSLGRIIGVIASVTIAITTVTGIVFVSYLLCFKRSCPNDTQYPIFKLV